jgi:hypothetical protein
MGYRVTHLPTVLFLAVLLHEVSHRYGKTSRAGEQFCWATIRHHDGTRLHGGIAPVRTVMNEGVDCMQIA